MNPPKLLQRLFLLPLVAATMAATSAFAQPTTFNDATNDIAPGIATAGGTLDIVKMEVVDTDTDVVFTMTVNGNFTAPNSDWGNFMIGIANQKTPGTVATNGNGWSRPINLNAGVTNGVTNGMTHWIGSWVNNGGGSQLWTYGTTNWSGPAALTSFTTAPAAQSTIIYTVSKESLGVTNGDTIIFDAYSSGGGGGDSAVDALSNPTNSITAWGGPYTSLAPTLTRSYTLANTALNTTQNITFSVDMNPQIDVGTFDPALDLVSVDWGSGFAFFQYLADSDGDGIYTGTAEVSAPSNTPVVYRFTIEPADPSAPLVPESGSRNFLMPDAPLTLATVYFNNIEGYRDVTFTVDMSGQETLGTFDPASQTVEVRGSFNGFSGGDVLAPQGGGLYAGTLLIGKTIGQPILYKFYTAGTGAVGYEQGSDRSFDLTLNPDGAPTPALVLPTATFLYEARNVTFSVDMSVQQVLGLFDPATGVVELRGLGGFGASDAKALTRVGSSTVYTGTFLVPGSAGANFSYKFYSAGINYFVETDPANTGYEIINQADRFQNRQIVLGASGTAQILDEAYFSNQLFGVLGTTTAPLPESTLVTFSAGQGTASAGQNVSVSGIDLTADVVATAPTGFEVSSDGTTYGPTASLTPTAGSVTSANLFVRVAASAPYGSLSADVSLSSTGSQPTNLSVTATVTPSSEVRNITFSVDMGVLIASGAFNPTDGVVQLRGLGGFGQDQAQPLAAQGGGIYSGTFSVPGVADVSTVEYKFYAVNAGSDPASPGFESGSNRTLTVGAEGVPQTLPTVYFSNQAPPVTRDVNFSVDMSVQIGLGNFDANDGVVEVRGPFNDWVGTTLTAQGAGIYSGTVSVPGTAGDSVDYKFWATGLDYESFAGNRNFVLGPAGELQILPTVFFNNDSGEARDVNFSVDMSVQIASGAFNPTGGVVEVRGPFNDWVGTALTAQGAGIYSGTVSVPGTAGDSVDYKFWATGLDYESFAGNRNFVLGPANVLQILPTVFFNNDAGGQTFAGWSGGQTLTPALELEYAIGGASAPGAGDGVASVTTVTADTLSITAVVRTNDPTLTVTGQALVDLAVGPWTTNNVTVTPQPEAEAPEGCEVQTFSTPNGTDGKKFLRLQTSLPAAP